MKLLLLVSAGGAIGAALRFLTYQMFAGIGAARGLGAFPWGTLTVNTIGSFLMGVVFVFVADRWGGSPEARAFLATGVLGGFTTFSAFSLDAMDLYINRDASAAAVYVGASVAVSIAALVAGIALTRWALQ